MADTVVPRKVIAIGLDPLSKALVAKSLPGVQIEELKLDLEAIMETPADPNAGTVVVGPAPPSTTTQEVAQVLRMQYPALTILYLTTDRTGFVRKEYLKNGFNEAFLMPLDEKPFLDFVQKAFAQLGDTRVKSYRSVKLLDMQPGQSMDFDTFIHLSANNKHIRLTAAGDEIDQERLARLAKHNVGNLHVHTADLDKFYKHTAEKLRKIGQAGAISETERRYRMQGAVRELISDMFQDASGDANFANGKAVLNDCQEIVKSYIMTSTAGGDRSWFKKLTELGQSANEAFSHPASVSTFGALFSMALGIGDPERVAMAGLLHDIGLSEVPAAILAKDPAEWTSDERTAYQRHPKISVTLVQNRKIVVDEVVLKIIAQHHERFDGKGYPDGLRGAKIHPEAQLLALADEFVYLISPRPGHAAMTPFQAIESIYQAIPVGEEGHAFDPIVVRRLYAALQNQV